MYVHNGCMCASYGHPVYGHTVSIESYHMICTLLMIVW